MAEYEKEQAFTNAHVSLSEGIQKYSKNTQGETISDYVVAAKQLRGYVVGTELWQKGAKKVVEKFGIVKRAMDGADEGTQKAMDVKTQIKQQENALEQQNIGVSLDKVPGKTPGPAQKI